MSNRCMCPQCNRYLNAPDEILGQEVQCPSCSKVFVAKPAVPDVFPGNLELTPSESDEAQEELDSSPDFEQESEMETEEEGYEDDGEDEEDYDDDEEEDYDEDEEDYSEEGSEIWVPRENGYPEKLPGERLSSFFSWMLAISALFLFVQTYASFEMFRNVTRYHGYPVTNTIALANSTLAFMLAFVVYLMTYIVFVMWIYRNFDNIRFLRVEEQRQTTKQAVFMSATPIINLLGAFGIMHILWKTSDPKASVQDITNWRYAKGTLHLPFLWLCCIISLVIFVMWLIYQSQFASYSYYYYDYFSIEGYIRTQAMYKMAWALAGLLSCLIMLHFVFQFQERQKARYHRVLTEEIRVWTEQESNEYDGDEYDEDEDEDEYNEDEDEFDTAEDEEYDEDEIIDEEQAELPEPDNTLAEEDDIGDFKRKEE